MIGDHARQGGGLCTPLIPKTIVVAPPRSVNCSRNLLVTSHQVLTTPLALNHLGHNRIRDAGRTSHNGDVFKWLPRAPIVGTIFGPAFMQCCYKPNKSIGSVSISSCEIMFKWHFTIIMNVLVSCPQMFARHHRNLTVQADPFEPTRLGDHTSYSEFRVTPGGSGSCEKDMGKWGKKRTREEETTRIEFTRPMVTTQKTTRMTITGSPKGRECLKRRQWPVTFCRGE